MRNLNVWMRREKEGQGSVEEPFVPSRQTRHISRVQEWYKEYDFKMKKRFHVDNLKVCMSREERGTVRQTHEVMGIVQWIQDEYI